MTDGKNNGWTPSHEEEAKGRRSFLAKIIGAGSLLWAAAAAYPILSYLKAPETEEEVLTEVDLGDPAQFKPGTATKFAFGKKPGFLLVDDGGNFSAVSAVCTHLGCIVHFDEGLKGFACACHGGKYDWTGENISGPPPKPLEKYKTELREGALWVLKG